MPSPGKSPDRIASRRARAAIAAGFVCVILLALSPRPTGAQGSTTIASGTPATKPVHHAVKRIKSSPEISANASGAGDSSASDNASPFALTAGKGPINIQSDSLSLDYKGKAVLFTGHVHAIQSGSKLTSDTLHVNYEENFKDVKDMTADGNVRISQGTRWATSDHAVMNQKADTVVLTGNPIVHDGPDQITGNRITVYLKTGNSVVDHAHALIYSHQSQTADNGASGAGAAAADGQATAGDQPPAIDSAANAAPADNAPAAEPDPNGR